VVYFVFTLYWPNQTAPVLGVRRAAYAPCISHGATNILWNR